MPDLPHGWRMRNSTVELSGPPHPTIPDRRTIDMSDGEDDGAGSSSEALDIEPDSDGWEDAEDDREVVSVQCLLCQEHFPAAATMLEHAKQTHQLDLLAVRQEKHLDFYGTIRLVNYIRSEFRRGKTVVDVTDSALWEDEKYLQPALEGDALLFSLDDLGDFPVDDEMQTQDESGTSKSQPA